MIQIYQIDTNALFSQVTKSVLSEVFIFFTGGDFFEQMYNKLYYIITGYALISK